MTKIYTRFCIEAQEINLYACKELFFQQYHHEEGDYLYEIEIPENEICFFDAVVSADEKFVAEGRDPLIMNETSRELYRHFLRSQGLTAGKLNDEWVVVGGIARLVIK